MPILQQPMPDDPLTLVRDYHEATKHHPGRYARSLGYLDWATQPDPFRRFQGSSLTTLPLPEPSPLPSYHQLFTPGNVQPSALGVESLSRFLYLSLAISAWKRAGDTTWALRCNPSSGNLHPSEGYLLLPAIEGLGAAGLYHYAPREHGLEQRCVLTPQAGQAFAAALPPGSFLVGLTSIHWREAWKYGERAFRYCQHDAGHALTALRLAAAALGWRLSVLDHFDSDELGRLLGTSRQEDFVAAEVEEPEFLAAVGPLNAPWPAEPLQRLAELVSQGRWTGRANALSRDRVDWPIIDRVAEATRKPPTAVPVEHPPTPPWAGEPEAGHGAFQIIRQRRSAVALDGRTGLSADAFYAILQRTMPAGPELRSVPFDALGWTPRVDLVLFVHLVQGLTPGVYVLVRHPQPPAELRAQMDPHFTRAAPLGCPPELPLFQLLEGDCRSLAAQLSLGQEIAGDGAFSLGMLADMDSALRECGPWGYRRLFWEAGMIGQVLYLEAEAAELRGTGIGAYFDDLVHELLGLRGNRFQSLYHFTVGGPLDDPRLTTLSSYPAPK